MARVSRSVSPRSQPKPVSLRQSASADTSAPPTASTPSGHIPSAHRYGAQDSLPSTVIVGMTIRLETSTAFRTDQFDAAEIEALSEHIGISRQTFRAARLKIARAAQVAPASLPIVVGVKAQEVTFAVVVPQGMDAQPLLDRTSTVVEAIVDLWHVGATAAVATAQAQADAMTPTQSTPLSSTPPLAPQASTLPLSPPLPAMDRPALVGSVLSECLDPAAQRLKSALLAHRQPGKVELSFVVGGQATQRQPLTIAAARPSPPVHISLGPVRRLTASVSRVSGPDQCVLREAGATRLQTAAFGTSSNLAILLKMVSGGPAVQLEVRDYRADVPLAPKHRTCRIERVIGLSSEWHKEPRILDQLQACLDQLKSLPLAPETLASGQG